MPPRRPAARRPRRARAAVALAAQAAAATAALLGLAAPAAAQAPHGDAPPGPALESAAGAPAAPQAPPGAQLLPAPPGYIPPPPALPPWANPRTIVYEAGDPIPRGYALKTRADRALVGAGLVTTIVPYAVSFTVAGIASLAEEDEFAPLFLPFVGPTIATSTLEAEGAGTFWLTVDMALQVGGLILIAAGMANEDVYLERQFDVGSSGVTHAASRWPEVSIGASSAALQWRF
ncbi:hypothetical protein [Sorangium sp. So ce131]|uniref:hypothetical protein n=1 Tax=Sorangium sp. So ce131 TaxID=3133282 RepID=UPI003F62F4FC